MTKQQPVAELLSQFYEQKYFTSAVAACATLTAPDAAKFWAVPGQAEERYDLASLTKALVTTPLTLWSLQASGLPLHSSLASWLGTGASKLWQPQLLALSVEALLGHRSGLPDWAALWVRCLDAGSARLSARALVLERLNQIAAKNLRPAGTYAYSDLGFLLLGLVLEEKHQKNLAELFHSFCQEELALSNVGLSFNLQAREREASVPTSFCAVRGRQLVGEVHDENASLLDGVAGHAGLFGSASELVVYLAALVASPLGKELLRCNSVKRRAEPGMHGLCGWHQGAGESSYGFGQGQALGHLGFTGTAFWLLPETLQLGVFLSNRVAIRRLMPEFTACRAQLFQSLYAAL